MELFYIQQIIAGESSRFSYFINTYKDFAFSIAVRIVSNPEDAEEIVQDAFLKAYTSLNQFRGKSKFSTWFYRIVVNIALNKARKKLVPTYELDTVELPEYLVANMEDTYRNFTQTERVKYVHLGLQRLKWEDALILTLYYLDEHTVGEIAEITAISPDNVKMQLHRARKKMYLVLSEILKTETINLLP
ncbi:MAG TPA: sigma-70 family RNA polymerase sigma factor [Flavitalea sp.]|nr:sigma-70 family RNA polymerase sigma factor [Flavitalea sp.]